MLDHSAVMRAVHPVLDERAPVAAGSASSQLRVELLQHLRRDLADGEVTHNRLDVPPRVRLIAGERVGLGGVDSQPGVERLAQRCIGSGVDLLLDLVYEPPQNALGFLLIRRRGRQPMRLASDRIDPGVHDDLERSPPLADVSAGASGQRDPSHVRTALDDTDVDIDQFGDHVGSLEGPKLLA